MKYITLSIFIFFCLGQTLVAQNKISREEISSLVGSALGAISSKSCGNKIKFADKIYRKYTNMLSYSVKKGQLSTQQKNDLVKIIIDSGLMILL